MAKLYLNQSPKKKVENLGPRKETISFLLNYSKALNVAESNNKHTFETILN